MRLFCLWHPTRRLGQPQQPLRVALDGSKSISNRALIIGALRGADPADGLKGLSRAADTQTLLQLLRRLPDECHAGEGGTTFRFLAAYLALKPGCRLLTGSARLLERPIEPLVTALRRLGARVECLGKAEGFAPLRICGPPPARLHPIRLAVPADVSSQFLSALLLVGPYLNGGLQLAPLGEVVSAPYLEMTLGLMRYFGAQVERDADGQINVAAGSYQHRTLRIEADWSAASYWYAFAALSDTAHICLEGLQSDSWQGDRVSGELADAFGVRSHFCQRGEVPEVLLCRQKSPTVLPPTFSYDFRACPDLVQTFAVLCAAKGVPAVFTGLQTLAHKETDRCAALQTELAKVGVRFKPLAAGRSDAFRLQGRAQWTHPPRFFTHGDHRMAMALAPLALIGPIEITHPEVVAKSYPRFWEHLQQAGFILEEHTL